jgi:hypothetical protein
MKAALEVVYYEQKVDLGRLIWVQLEVISVE